MPTQSRRCSTCRHFAPAPLWRKGWCRHPLLYAPHQNHLVDERDLDCHRQFGDYWEARETTTPAEPVGPVVSVVSGGAGAAPPDATLSASDVESSTPETGSERVVDSGVAAPEVDGGASSAHTRSDRLRLAVPALIVGGLLVAYLVWTGFLLRSAGDAAPPAEATATTAPIVAPTAALATAPASVPTVAATVAPTARPTLAPTASLTAAAAPTRSATPVGLRGGTAAVVDTGSTDGLRLRREPSATAVVLRTIRNGERVSVLDGPRDVDGISWWRVAYAGDEGWVAGQYLKPAA